LKLAGLIELERKYPHANATEEEMFMATVLMLMQKTGKYL